jgi:hypothetical protein
MACPHLKEVVMLFCDAYPAKKMLPLDRIATADPCLCGFETCPIFQELLARIGAQPGTPAPDEAQPPAAMRKGAAR